MSIQKLKKSGNAEAYVFAIKIRTSAGGGKRPDTCDHGLSRRSLGVRKTSYELSWRVTVTAKKRKRRKKRESQHGHWARWMSFPCTIKMKLVA